MKYRMTLSNGTQYEFTPKTAQDRRFRKSRLMALAPYGSDFQGATFEVVPEPEK